MAITRKRKRRTVEIYFVLYLAALILLLPNRDSKNTFFHSNVSPSEITMQAEKTIMTCKMRHQANGSQIISIDSLNTIFFRGDVANINYDVIIEDLTQRIKVKLNNSNMNDSKFFKIEENEANSELKFFWRPNTGELLNKNYLVKIFAKVYTKNSTTTPIELHTQFTLNLYFEDEVQLYAGANGQKSGDGNQLNNNSVQNQQNQNSNFGQNQSNQNSGDFDLSPANNRIQAIAYSTWKNIVNCYGINLKKELAAYPSVTIDKSDIGGSATITKVDDNAIYIEGKTPYYSQIEVRVSLTRKFDQKNISTTFSVKPAAFGDPEFEKPMYPEISYKIQPKLPILVGQQVSAFIKDKDNNVRAASQDGGNFQFTPSITDTNKTLFLERYIDNKLLGQKHQLYIKNTPSPEIEEVSIKDDYTIIIRTISYGVYLGKNNYVKNIITNNKELTVRELYGDNPNQNNWIIKQKFEVKGKHQRSSGLWFKAQDQRNYLSVDKNIYGR